MQERWEDPSAEYALSRDGDKLDGVGSENVHHVAADATAGTQPLSTNSWLQINKQRGSNVQPQEKHEISSTLPRSHHNIPRRSCGALEGMLEMQAARNGRRLIRPAGRGASCPSARARGTASGRAWRA